MSANETLSPRRRLGIGVFALAMIAVGFGVGRATLRPSLRVAQPVQFNHLKHTEEVGLECATCHEYFTTSEHSGLPSLDLCEGCHSEALGKSSEEQTLLKLIATEPRPSFEKLFRLPDDIRYSHLRHVAVGGLACDTCHGEIAKTTAPPPVALQRITMATCLNCHAERGVQTDCSACHR